MLDYNSIIKTTMSSVPKGWKQTLTVDEYTALDGKKKRYYNPVYGSYKTKKRREYGECEYGERHFLGWEEYRVGVGEPISWEYVGYFGAVMIEQILDGSLLRDRMIASATGKGGPMTEDEAIKFNGRMDHE